AATLLLGACSILPEPKPAHYRTVVLDAVTPAAPAATGPTVALGAVELPAYLDTDAVVVRAAENEIRYARDERRGEPLTAAVPRILAADLGAGGVNVLPQGSRAERTVDVAIARFEAGADGRAELRARWTLRDREQVRGGEVHLVAERAGPAGL